MTNKDIIDAWAEIRRTNQSIPDEVLDFMKDSALAGIESNLLATPLRDLEASDNKSSNISCDAPFDSSNSIEQIKTAEDLVKQRGIGAVFFTKTGKKRQIVSDSKQGYYTNNNKGNIQWIPKTAEVFMVDEENPFDITHDYFYWKNKAEHFEKEFDSANQEVIYLKNNTYEIFREGFLRRGRNPLINEDVCRQLFNDYILSNSEQEQQRSVANTLNSNTEPLLNQKEDNNVTNNQQGWTDAFETLIGYCEAWVKTGLAPHELEAVCIEARELCSQQQTPDEAVVASHTSGFGNSIEQKKFTMNDFEKGLMLAGLVKPNNEQEQKEFNLLQLTEALDACFGVMMQPYLIESEKAKEKAHRLGVSIHSETWAEARSRAEKMYYESKSLLNKVLNDAGSDTTKAEAVDEAGIKKAMLQLKGMWGNTEQEANS
jgi:hypothetical protein